MKITKSPTLWIAIVLAALAIGFTLQVATHQKPNVIHKVLLPHHPDTASKRLNAIKASNIRFDDKIDTVAMEGNAIADSLYRESHTAILAYRKREIKLFKLHFAKAKVLKHKLDVNQALLKLMISQRKEPM